MLFELFYEEKENSWRGVVFPYGLVLGFLGGDNVETEKLEKFCQV